MTQATSDFDQDILPPHIAAALKVERRLGWGLPLPGDPEALLDWERLPTDEDRRRVCAIARKRQNEERIKDFKFKAYQFTRRQIEAMQR